MGDRQGDSRFANVLPVLFYEYLALSLTRSLIPLMIIEAFGSHAYLAVGIMETVKGVLAFVSCPLWGRVSDRVGRKACLFLTVVGSTAPIWVLAFTTNMYIYTVVASLSGFFSATFPLTFAYISDCVSDKQKRAPAYGLALATFGLSFSIGPITGSYIASQLGPRAVFVLSLVLIVVDGVYILTVLPETVHAAIPESDQGLAVHPSIDKFSEAIGTLPNTWDVRETFRVFRRDLFMTNLALIVFLYYTSVWAIVSTLMVYVTRQLHFSPITLGWLLSGYGVATMFSEGVVVRLIVPRIGETNSIRIGLVSFAAQCAVVAFSTSSTSIFASILFSMLSNLVYPSISSLVSKVVEEGVQGEALGALNGIKALTEGFGPLSFGLLMGLYEDTPTPGAPYLLASLLALWAFLQTFELPAEPEVLLARGLAKGGLAETEGLLSADGEDGDL